MNQAKIYVGNLSYQTTSDALSDAFGSYGEIVELKLIMDRETGRSKGFAFITFGNSDAAEAALSLNGTELDGRRIKVSIAKEDRGGGGGGRRRNNHRGNFNSRNR